MKYKVLTLALCLIGAASHAQDEIKPVIKFHGLIKNDFALDSRQTVNAREGHFLLWPEKKKPDADGYDINAKSNLNFLSLQSRIGVSVTGIEAGGAKITGMIEGDFFGQSDDNINLIRLRHAYMKLNWKKTEALAGQFWNPMFTLDCYPGAVSFNTGVPFMPFSRNVQLRITQSAGSFRFVAAALGQRDYTSFGGSSPMRNAASPDLHAQVQYYRKNLDTKNEFAAGIGGAYKSIVPMLETANGYKTNAAVRGFSTLGYVKVKYNKLTAKAHGLWGQNLYDVVQLSSYAVSKVVDEEKGLVEYVPTRNYSVWAEIHSNTKVQVGLFSGFTKNLGSNQKASAVACRGSDIDYAWRVSPRVVVPVGIVHIGMELEHTVAAYGTIGEYAQVENSEEVANTRLLFSTYFSF